MNHRNLSCLATVMPMGGRAAMALQKLHTTPGRTPGVWTQEPGVTLSDSQSLAMGCLTFRTFVLPEHSALKVTSVQRNQQLTGPLSCNLRMKP